MHTARISSEKLLSTYRAALMGLAMLGIMLHHFDKLEGMHYTFFPFDFAGPAVLWWGVEVFSSFFPVWGATIPAARAVHGCFTRGEFCVFCLPP
ncbi:hypothetical protein [Akkermansia glycaniphila]|uniref:hypothetical protein n=1 Tax=Akkermansia glycaniphila TaxID=1679444 RepID=UPI001FE1DA44|nr:hypothetical protein [Akkermansia glycaniphila]